MARRPERGARGAPARPAPHHRHRCSIAGFDDGRLGSRVRPRRLRRGLRGARHGQRPAPASRPTTSWSSRCASARRPTATSSPARCPMADSSWRRTVAAGELVPDSAVDDVDRSGLASRRRAEPWCVAERPRPGLDASTCGRRAKSSAARTSRRPCWSRVPRSPAIREPEGMVESGGASVELLDPAREGRRAARGAHRRRRDRPRPGSGDRRLMARLALALDPATEDRLLADAVEHGHTIVARLVGLERCARQPRRPRSRRRARRSGSCHVER